MKQLFLATLITILFSACENCKECMLVEETDGVKHETPVGEKCDQHIDELESQDLVCLSDECYYQCK